MTFVPVRALRFSVAPALAVPLLKLKTLGDRSLSSAGPRAWSSLPHFRRASALACSDETVCTAFALLYCCLLATHFCEDSFESSFVATSSIEERLTDSVLIATIRALRSLYKKSPSEKFPSVSCTLCCCYCREGASWHRGYSLWLSVKGRDFEPT